MIENDPTTDENEAGRDGEARPADHDQCGRANDDPRVPRERKPGRAGVERERVGDSVTIYRDAAASPFWHIQYSLDGRQFRRSLKTAKRDRALKIAKEKESLLYLGQAGHAADAKPVTIAAAREQYLRSLKTKGKSPKTVGGYGSKLAVFEAFCAARHVRLLRQVTAQVLEGFQSEVEERGVVPPGKRPKGSRGPGFKAAGNMPRTVRDKAKVVRQLINWALERRLLREDPAAGYDLLKAVKTMAYCWTAAELTAVIDHAPAGFRDLFEFLRMTGLRAEELCWLTKGDLSVSDPPHVKVRAKTCPITGRAWRPKHGNERVVPLCPEALAIAATAAAASPGPWLFHAPNTNGPQTGLWRKNRIWLAVKAAMRAGGVTRGTTHTFRHAFCSFLARRGVSPFAIMRVMGHDSLDIVLQYCHTTDRDLADAVAGVGFAAMLAPPAGADAAGSAAATANGAPADGCGPGTAGAPAVADATGPARTTGATSGLDQVSPREIAGGGGRPANS